MKDKAFSVRPVCVAVLLACAAHTVQANPYGASVVNGQVSFATAGNTLTVTNTPGSIINWQGFSIGANEITRFAQQSASSAVLNRVISGNPSSILGSLLSNGRVFLVNPNGIVFGAGSTINVAGLVATTLNISNADFLAGRNNFTQVPGAQNISNAGNITAQSGGQIFLIAPNVENTGVITAPNGEILLAAGHSVELVNSNEPSLRVNITAAAGDATNVGQLVASAGNLGLFGAVVRNSGIVSADSATMQGGKIVLKATQRTEISGTVSANGTGGGEIKVLADMQNGTVDVNAVLEANAPSAGNGGFIETSAAHVQVSETAHISTAAPYGKSGTWLIDPQDFTIAAAGGDITGVALSTALNSSNVLIQSVSGAMAGNGDIFVSDNIIKTATAGTTTLTLQAESSIIVSSNTTISSSGDALNVVFNADTDGLNGGAIVMNSGSSIASNGGNITLGGGVAGDGTGNAVGNATYIDGIYLDNATLDAGGGKIAMNGTGVAGTAAANGIYVTNASHIQTSGAGTITLNGTGGAGTSNNNGVLIGTNSVISSINGAIALIGYGAGSVGSNYGVYVHNGATVGATGSGTITFNGTGSTTGTTSNTGIRISASGGATQITSVSGTVSMTGIGGTDGDGLQVVSGAIVQSGAGDITLQGTGGNGGTANDGVYVTGTGTLISSGGNIGITGDNLNTVGTSNRGVAITSSAHVVATSAGTLTMNGTGGYDGDGLDVHGGALVQTDTGLLTLNGISGNGTGSNWDWGTVLYGIGTQVTSGGGMNITGISTSTNSADSNHGIIVNQGAKLITTAGLMTLSGAKGAGATSNAVLLSGTPAGGVVNAAAGLNIYGLTGDVVVDTGAILNVTGNANISSYNNILFSANSSLASLAGPVNISLNPGNDGGIRGGIYLDTGSSLNSNGGYIHMGSASTRSIGNGTVTGGKTFDSGIYVLGDVTAGAGNVTMYGEGANNNFADGITFAGGTLSSNGIVTIDGIAHGYSTGTSAPNLFAAGVDFLGTATRLTTQTGTVIVTGLNTAPNADPYYYRADGIMVETGTILETTGSGTLTFNGTANSFNTSWGMGVLGGTIRTTAAGGGAITLNGTNASGLADGGVVILGGNVLSNGGEIRMVGSGLGGSVGIVGGSTIGGSSSGNILIQANNSGTIDLNASTINAGGSTLTIKTAGGVVTDNSLATSSIIAGALRLLGSGTFNLDSASNDIGTLAATVTGSVNYADANSFSVGYAYSFDGANYTSTDGLATNGGAITLTAAGDINQTSGLISNNVTSGTAPVSDITLNAANITLQQVQSQRHVVLNATAGVNLLGVGSGGYIDDTYFQFNLPFSFSYFGTSYNQAYITTNGLIMFGYSPTSSYSDSLSGLGYYKAIAPAWNDWMLNASIGKDIRIGYGANDMKVRFDVVRYGNTSLNTQFESVLNSNGVINFNYGAANSSFAGDVTIGLSNGMGTAIASQLMYQPNFSMNYLNSTTFTPNGSGGYTEMVSAGSAPLSHPGIISGSAILGQGTGQVVNALGNLNINAGGAINAPSRLAAQTLNFIAHGGAIFTGDNYFSSISGTNYTSGDVIFYNTAATLLVNPLGNTGGNILLNNFGGIEAAGAVSSSGNLEMSAQDQLMVSNGATLNAGGNLNLSVIAATPTAGDLNVNGGVGASGTLTATAGNINVNAGGYFNTSSGALSATAGNDVNVLDGGYLNTLSGEIDVAAVGNVNLATGGYINTSSGDVVVIAGNDVSVNAGHVSGATAALLVGNDLNIQNGSIWSNGVLYGLVGHDVNITGGASGLSGLFGNPDVGSASVPFVVGGTINLNDDATGTYGGQIHSGMPYSTWVHFPNLASGGYFVNGVEGAVTNGASGFYANGQSAVLDSNLHVSYGLTLPSVAPAPAATPIVAPPQVLASLVNLPRFDFTASLPSVTMSAVDLAMAISPAAAGPDEGNGETQVVESVGVCK